MTNTNLFITPNEYFKSIVADAMTARKIDSFPMAQMYIVNILEFYLDAKNLFEEDSAGKRKNETLAEMYLTANQLPQSQKTGLLKRCADRSLYISGFFGDSLNRKLVDIDYYADVGGAAYSSLANTVQDDLMIQTYQHLSDRFLDYVEVLTYISEKSYVKSDQNILRLYDRYLKTGSDLAKEKLIELGVMAPAVENLKSTKS